MKRQSNTHPYVGRGGLKLEFALDAFDIGPTNWTAADLGSHVGGFVDCLLQHGAARVYSVDTSYGTFAWKLRTDPRVVVMERTNAMHVRLPESVDLVTIDVGWTRQKAILPRAVELVRPGGTVISLLKPQYEADPALVKKGALVSEHVRPTVRRVIDELLAEDLPVAAATESPVRGGKGNVEFFLLLHRVVE